MPKTIAARYQIASLYHWTKKVNVVTPSTMYKHKGGVIISVNFKGTVFKPGMAICPSLMENGDPEIGIITCIKDGPSPRLCFHNASVRYVSHIRAYEVHSTDKDGETEISVDRLVNILPMDILFYGSKRVLSQRSSLV